MGEGVNEARVFAFSLGRLLKADGDKSAYACEVRLQVCKCDSAPRRRSGRAYLYGVELTCPTLEAVQA